MNQTKVFQDILTLNKTLSICQLKNLNENDTLKCIKDKIGFLNENLLRVLLVAPFD